MPHPIRSTFKRKPRRRVVSRSFRIPPDVDRDLDVIAKEKSWTKSFLIRDIIVSYIGFHRAKARVE